MKQKIYIIEEKTRRSWAVIADECYTNKKTANQFCRDLNHLCSTKKKEYRVVTYFRESEDR